MSDREDAVTQAFNDVGRQALVAAASALAAGLASLTFVAVVGGAVLMARLRGAGLPTEAAIAVQSRPVLLAVGGEVLAPAVFVALAAVFAVHFIGSCRAVLPLNGQGGQRSPSSAVRRWLFAIAVWILGVAYYLGWSAGALHFPMQFLTCVVIAVFAGVVAYAGGRLAATAVQARETRHALARARGIEDPPGPRHAHLVRVEATYLAALAAVIMLFATVAAVTASLADPKIRPAAVLFDDDRGPLCGIFVAQNGDHLYIAEAVEDPHIENIGRHREGRMLDLPRSSVRALALGSGQSISQAHTAAPKLLAELVGIHRAWAQRGRAFNCRQPATR